MPASGNRSRPSSSATVSSSSTKASKPGACAGGDIRGQIFDPLGNQIGDEVRLGRHLDGDGERSFNLAPLEHLRNKGGRPADRIRAWERQPKGSFDGISARRKVPSSSIR